MRTSSNPAFRNLPTSPGGYASFGAGATAGMTSGGFGGGPQAPATGVGDRPVTVDDIVQKTAICIGTALVVGVLTLMSGFYVLGIVGFIVGLVLSLIIIFKQVTHPAMILGYSAAMGMALGAITGMFQSMLPPNYGSIGIQAILATFGILVGMLVVYKTGAVRVTPRLTKMVIGAAIGVMVLMLGNLVASFFMDGGFGLRDGGPLAIGFSLVCIGIGAFMLLLDFDQADQAVQAGVPAKFAWFLAFGFMTTLVWLYIEILRLLSYFALSQD